MLLILRQIGKIRTIDQQLFLIDFYLPDYNIALYCDGDYWHSLVNVKNRDNYFNKKLSESGYNVVRISEHEIKKDISKIISNII